MSDKRKERVVEKVKRAGQDIINFCLGKDLDPFSENGLPHHQDARQRWLNSRETMDMGKGLDQLQSDEELLLKAPFS